ncbi:hypothetical protein PTKIN_Ptkin12aG0030000 [Pterospermum kingtungense]
MKKAPSSYKINALPLILSLVDDPGLLPTDLLSPNDDFWSGFQNQWSNALAFALIDFSKGSYSSPSKWKLQIGEDTRKNFTSYLYRDLKRKGIGAYMDEKDLPKGADLSPALF